jgi:hypothetical protein
MIGDSNRQPQASPGAGVCSSIASSSASSLTRIFFSASAPWSSPQAQYRFSTAELNFSIQIETTNVAEALRGGTSAYIGKTYRLPETRQQVEQRSCHG